MCYLKLGRIYLPLEDLKTFHCSEEDLLNRQDSTHLRRLLAFYGEKAESYYQKAFKEFEHDSEDKLIAAKIMAKVYYRILQKLKKKDFNVLQGKVKLSKLEKVWLILPFFVKRLFKKQ